ncbi:MAG TPA: hypothetical protein VNA13_02745 [Xanthomonadales bacterium]|nr:hypothetical protein [Xanthomonadales bacterium]
MTERGGPTEEMQATSRNGQRVVSNGKGYGDGEGVVNESAPQTRRSVTMERMDADPGFARTVFVAALIGTNKG